MDQTTEILTKNHNQQDEQSEITIFVIPALSHIDWSNPSTLFKTTLKCFLKAPLRRNFYVIGHTVARIKSPKFKKPAYIAMSGKYHTEKATSVFLRKMGLGVLGATLKGHIESEKKILKGLKMYGKRNMVSYIRFKVNEESVDRVLQFVDRFENKSTLKCAPCELYNGATWPRYENEGSGCSSFGMAVLDVAGILPPGSEKWKVNIKIPMNLIGGEANQYKKINIRTILKTKSWYSGNGKEDVDFVYYNVYDPELIFDWIKEQRVSTTDKTIIESENGIDGLFIDMSNVKITEPIFLHRTKSNLFVKGYYHHITNLIAGKSIEELVNK